LADKSKPLERPAGEDVSFSSVDLPEDGRNYASALATSPTVVVFANNQSSLHCLTNGGRHPSAGSGWRRFSSTVVPLPHDNPAERLISWLGWGSGEELILGRQLLLALRGRCDLVLHGHRHDPVALPADGNERRPLSLFNAGSSTELGHVRLFMHRRGRLAAPPIWMPLQRDKPAPFFEYVGSSPAAGPG
jgi:hypothetical protein